MPELITDPAAVPIPILPETEGELVVAENPGEMQKAQATVLTWADAKLQAAKQDLLEARECHKTATQAGWNKAPFSKRVRTAELTVNYYEKVVAAIEEGYCIVPNFPVTLLAIRVLADLPDVNVHTPGYNPGLVELDGADSDAAVGEGEYIDPQVKVRENHWLQEKDAAGKVTQRWWKADEFRDVSLPVKFMKPRVLDATKHAMEMKIFDEVGALPARKKTDPVMIGRIVGPKGKSLSFLISWFIGKEDL